MDAPAVRAPLAGARPPGDDGGEAGDVVAAAREADSLMIRCSWALRMIARVITDVGISDTGLPLLGHRRR